MKFFAAFIIYILIFTGGAFAYTPEEIDEAFAQLEGSDPIAQAKAAYLLSSQISMGSFKFYPIFPILERLVRMTNERSSSDPQLSARAKKIIKMGLNHTERIRTLVLHVGVPGTEGILAKALLQEILPHPKALRSILHSFKSGQPVLKGDYAEVLSAVSHDPEVIAALTSELNATASNEIHYRKTLILALAGYTNTNCPPQIYSAHNNYLFQSRNIMERLVHSAIDGNAKADFHRAGATELLLRLLHAPEMRSRILKELTRSTFFSPGNRTHIRALTERVLPILRSYYLEAPGRIPITTEEMTAMQTFLSWGIGHEVPLQNYQDAVECTLAMLTHDLSQVKHLDLSFFVPPLAASISRYRALPVNISTP